MKRCLLLFFILLTTLLSAKDLTILAVDKDLDIPLEGVKIVVTGVDKIFYTDSDGKASLVFDDKINKLFVIAILIGYENKKAIINNFDTPFVIKMSIQGLLEGKELVIEERSIGKKDEKVGVSTVVDKQMIDSSAKIGPVEDIMSSIKTLPGVAYGGKFDSKPSIRGGHPDEVVQHLMDFL